MSDVADMNREDQADVSSLRRAAANGDVAAKAALGHHLLTVPPFNLNEGVALTLAAEQAGNADAGHLAASLAGVGAGMTQSWSRALDFLQTAAERGHAEARVELELIARAYRPPAPLFEPSLKHLRQSIDLGAWFRPARPEGLRTVPRIGMVRGFTTPAICDWVIERARPRLNRATVHDGQQVDARHDESRTNSAMCFTHVDSDLVILMLRSRVAALVGLPIGALEPTSILHYLPGQEFKTHVDFLDPASPVFAEELGVLGQRVMTFLLYLNDDYDGAETEFSSVNWRFKGKKGDALIFWNVQPNGFPDPMTWHAGLPPTRGEKWLLSQWIRCLIPGQGKFPPPGAR